MKYDLGKATFNFYEDKSAVFRREEMSDEIYKVYYSWQIVNGNAILFDMSMDECSALLSVAEAIRYVLKKKKYYRVISPGQPGSIWEFRYRKRWSLDGNDFIRDTENDSLEITVFNSLTDQGYRFWLRKEDALSFAKFIDKVNKEMLKRSEA